MKKTQAKVGAYCRCSTSDKQTVRMQKSAIREWARSQHIPLSEIRWYLDRGVSGAKNGADRPALARLLKALERGSVDCLVLYSLSRLSRKTTDGLQILSDLGKRGIRVVSVSENVDFGSSMGELLSTILLAFASYQRSQIIDNVKQGLRAARERGVTLGRPRNQKRLNRIRKMNETMTPLEIASKLSCSRQNVYACLSRA